MPFKLQDCFPSAFKNDAKTNFEKAPSSIRDSARGSHVFLDISSRASGKREEGDREPIISAGAQGPKWPKFSLKGVSLLGGKDPNTAARTVQVHSHVRENLSTAPSGATISFQRSTTSNCKGKPSMQILCQVIPSQALRGHRVSANYVVVQSQKSLLDASCTADGRGSNGTQNGRIHGNPRWSVASCSDANFNVSSSITASSALIAQNLISPQNQTDCVFLDPVVAGQDAQATMDLLLSALNPYMPLRGASRTKEGGGSGVPQAAHRFSTQLQNLIYRDPQLQAALHDLAKEVVLNPLCMGLEPITLTSTVLCYHSNSTTPSTLIPSDSGSSFPPPYERTGRSATGADPSGRAGLRGDPVSGSGRPWTGGGFAIGIILSGTYIHNPGTGALEPAVCIEMCQPKLFNPAEPEKPFSSLARSLDPIAPLGILREDEYTHGSLTRASGRQSSINMPPSVHTPPPPAVDLVRGWEMLENVPIMATLIDGEQA